MGGVEIDNHNTLCLSIPFKLLECKSTCQIVGAAKNKLIKKKKKKLTLKKALPQFFNLTAEAAEEEYLWEHGKTT